MDPLDAIRRAGRIASKVRERIRSRIEAGVKVIQICEDVECWIRELGGQPAFPCNVDIDHVAAHYTSPPQDQMTVPEGSLVKVDLGVHIDGYIADTATTVCLDPRYEVLIEAAEEALEEAIRRIRAGVRASEIGSVIERAMRRRGAVPVRNLTGHRMARYIVHAGEAIPNVASPHLHRLRAGDLYAVEPFATLPEASGEVVDGPPGNIYIFKKKRSLSGEMAREMLRIIQSEYRTLPFAHRWISRRFQGQEGEKAFMELVDSRCIYSYPQLLERSRRPVAQAEHSLIVTEDGCEVITA
ncbi:MAG: type II methionyl aminopeptidase [Candidatus Bathyarchaeia archaeon]|nr:type II methionyl aminopeptidase [Candidatus Bathyarchaeota archaeon]